MPRKFPPAALLSVMVVLVPVSVPRLAPAAGEGIPGVGDVGAVPHLDDAGRAAYREFLAAGDHRAFAIAPGGTWTWVAESAGAETATAEALAECRRLTDQPCFPYAVDGARVFDRAAWNHAWRLPVAAAPPPVGTARGHRFPDLAVTDPDGTATTLSALRGRVVLVHFWGSWCLPCAMELPDLQNLYDTVGGDGDIAFVPLQGREPIAASRRWARRRAVGLPLYDSGTRDRAFPLADGGTLADRVLAPVFPATYVLDRAGRVVFARRGPGHRWIEYAPLLRDLATAGP